MIDGIQIEPHDEAPWFVRYYIPYERPDLWNAIKPYPGVRWIDNGKYWLVPMEVHQLLTARKT